MALEYEEFTERIIGGGIEVHKGLGPGFLESIYENAFAVELRARDIPFQRPVSVPVLYRGVEERPSPAGPVRVRPYCRRTQGHQAI